MSCSLPTFWVHNDDGTVTERGGDMDGCRKTSPTGSYIRESQQSSLHRRSISGTSQIVSSTNITRDIARHVVAQKNFILNVRNGKKVVVICDLCKRRDIVGSYNLGNVDICTSCAESL